MARLKQGITSPGKGKVANVIMYEMYGKSYVRARPDRYKDRKSQKQLAQRQRLQLAQDFVRGFNPLVRITMKDAAIGRSPYHTAVSLNLKEAVAGEYPDQYINPEKVILSRGKLALPDHITARKTEEGILLEWSEETDQDGSKRASDNLIWCMKDLEALSFTNYQITTVKRGEGRHLLHLPQSQNPVDIWGMFRSADEIKISETQWMGRF
jgi:hypothetical protein